MIFVNFFFFFFRNLNVLSFLLIYIHWRHSIKAVSDLWFALATIAVLRNVLQIKKYSGELGSG